MRTRALLVLTLTAVVAGCRSAPTEFAGPAATAGLAPPRHLSELFGRIVSTEAAVLARIEQGNGEAPGRRAGASTFAVRRTMEGTQDVVLYLADEQVAGDLEAWWNDVAIEVLRVPTPSGWTFRVSFGEVTAGRLQLRGLERGAIPRPLASDGIVAPLADDRSEREWRALRDMLQQGMVEAGGFRQGGALFVGSAGLPADIVVPVDGELRAALMNGSSQQVQVVVATDRGEFPVQVAAMSSAPLAVPVQAGERIRELRVEGSDDGVLFLAAPRWSRSNVAAVPAAVVVITMDTVRRDAVGAVRRDGRAVTPVLDALRAQAVTFERAHTTAPWTLPAHASMFTATYPSIHRLGVVDTYLREDLPTLAGSLADLGYIGMGFAGGPFAGTRWGLARGFHRYRNASGRFEAGAVLTEAASAFLESATAPTFLFVNYFDAHFPYGDARGDVTPGTRSDAATRWLRMWQGLEPITDELIAVAREAYLDDVHEVDAQIGVLFDTLRRLGVWDGALIVVTSDHGEFLGENGNALHGYRVDPELIEIPLIVKLPGQGAASSYAEPVSLVDVMPLVLAAVNGRGNDLPSNLATRGVVLAEEHSEPSAHPLRPHRKVADHLYARYGQQTVESVWEGGGECRERAGGRWRLASCAVSPAQLLQELLAALPLPIAGARAPELDEATKRGLRSLGYLR